MTHRTATNRGTFSATASCNGKCTSLQATMGCNAATQNRPETRAKPSVALQRTLRNEGAFCEPLRCTPPPRGCATCNACNDKAETTCSKTY